MAAKNISDMFYDISGFDKTDGDAVDYVSTTDLADTYIPLSIKRIAALVGSTWSVTDYTTGDILQDRIIAYYAVCFAKQTKGMKPYYPQNGSPYYEDCETANELLLQTYGTLDKYGTLRYPTQTEDVTAATYMNMNTCKR